MQKVELPSRDISHFGSRGFTHTLVARGETFQAGIVELDGVVGGHNAASHQLLAVLSGRVICSTRDEEVELGVGEAVTWEEGEWHETRSLEKSQLLILEGAFA